jgi:hypothetical protein
VTPRVRNKDRSKVKTWPGMTNVAFECLNEFQVQIPAYYIHLNVPEFRAVTLFTPPISRVGLHVLVNLHCNVYCGRHFSN